MTLLAMFTPEFGFFTVALSGGVCWVSGRGRRMGGSEGGSDPVLSCTPGLLDRKLQLGAITLSILFLTTGENARPVTAGGDNLRDVID